MGKKRARTQGRGSVETCVESQKAAKKHQAAQDAKAAAKKKAPSHVGRQQQKAAVAAGGGVPDLLELQASELAARCTKGLARRSEVAALVEAVRGALAGAAVGEVRAGDLAAGLRLHDDGATLAWAPPRALELVGSYAAETCLGKLPGAGRVDTASPRSPPPRARSCRARTSSPTAIRSPPAV